MEEEKCKENRKWEPDLIVQHLGCLAEKEQGWITTSVPRLDSVFCIRQSLNKTNLGAVPGVVHTHAVAELGPRSFPQVRFVVPFMQKIEFSPIVAVTWFSQ